MKLTSFILCAGFCLSSAALHAAPPVACNKTDQSPKENAVCISWHYQERAKHHRELLGYSQRYLREGDALFLKKQYDKAADAYELASDNAGTAYSRLQNGEAVLLRLATATKFYDENLKSTGACLLPNRFAWAMDVTLSQKYLVGIEIAKISKAGRPISKARLADAERKAACMQGLADEYRDKKEGCVDMNKLRACMGLPAR